MILCLHMAQECEELVILAWVKEYSWAKTPCLRMAWPLTSPIHQLALHNFNVKKLRSIIFFKTFIGMQRVKMFDCVWVDDLIIHNSINILMCKGLKPLMWVDDLIYLCGVQAGMVNNCWALKLVIITYDWCWVINSFRLDNVFMNKVITTD